MDIPQNLVNVALDVMLTRYLAVATVTFFFYDYLITLDEEILLVWPSTLNFAKVVFLLNRYLPFVTTVLGGYLTVFTTRYDMCETVFIASTVIICIAYIVSEVILFMRTYAIWGRNVYVLVLLSGTLGTSIVGAFYCLSRYIASTTRFHLFHSGCLHVFPNRIIWITMIILVYCETLSLCLLLIKRLYHFRYSNSHLMKTIYKDGVFYYVLILCTTTANLLVLRLASSTMDTFLFIPQSVLHSILCTRLLLRIRGAYSSLSTDIFQSSQYSRHELAFESIQLQPTAPPS